MQRNIFVVDATIVDANGTFNHLPNYPKLFDSHSYDDDINKARKRAEGDMSEAWGAMCKRDDRQLQTVTLTTVDGHQIEKKSMGRVADLPDPQPEPEPEPEENIPEEE